MGAAESVPGLDLLCSQPRDLCGANGGGGKGADRLASPVSLAAKEAMQDSIPDPLEEMHALETCRSWLEAREIADVQGAALLSTTNITVRTPLGQIQGIEAVKAQIYAAESPPVTSNTELVAKRVRPGVWSVRRHYVVTKDGCEFTLQQVWSVVTQPTKKGRRGYEALIAEVTSSIA